MAAGDNANLERLSPIKGHVGRLTAVSRVIATGNDAGQRPSRTAHFPDLSEVCIGPEDVLWPGNEPGPFDGTGDRPLDPVDRNSRLFEAVELLGEKVGGTHTVAGVEHISRENNEVDVRFESNVEDTPGRQIAGVQKHIPRGGGKIGNAEYRCVQHEVGGV